MEVIAALVGAGVGAVLGFAGGRLAAHWENQARRSDAVALSQLDRVHLTRDFYVRLLDWELQFLTFSAGKPRPGPRPRFAEAPSVNLALLGSAQLTQRTNSFLRKQMLRHDGMWGSGTRQEITEAIELERQIIEAAGSRAEALLRGKANAIPPDDIANQAKWERIEEAKADSR